MPVAQHSIVGTIRVEPLRREAAAASGEDSTLGLLLESLAYQDSLAADVRANSDSIHLLLATRVSRFNALAEGHGIVQANVDQLATDLDADYERLTIAARRTE